jgi:hypothetical protein
LHLRKKSAFEISTFLREIAFRLFLLTIAELIFYPLADPNHHLKVYTVFLSAKNDEVMGEIVCRFLKIGGYGLGLRCNKLEPCCILMEKLTT